METEEFGGGNGGVEVTLGVIPSWKPTKKKPVTIIKLYRRQE